MNALAAGAEVHIRVMKKRIDEQWVPQRAIRQEPPWIGYNLEVIDGPLSES
jgi:hypothetical protein